MFPISITVTRQGVGTNVSLWNQLLREAWMHAIRLWFRFILPKHFTLEAKVEYDYQPREVKYSRRKGKKYGHQRPLVFSGRLMREVLARTTDIRVTSKGGRAFLHGPQYLFQYWKRGATTSRGYSHFGQPDKAAELSAISDRDREFLARAMDKFITRRARQIDRAQSGAAAARTGLRTRGLSA